MADTELDIVNSALVRVGEKPITSGDFATPPAAHVAAVVAELEYAAARDEELRLHPWAFALVRATLLAYTEPAATLTPGGGATVLGTTGVVFTAGIPVFAAGDVGKTLENASGTGKALITGFTSTTVVTATITEAFPSIAAIAAADWRLYYAAPANTWTRKIAVPSGLLRLWHVRHEVPYRAEGAYYVTDADSLDVVYVARITDPTLFDPAFDEALKARLALKFANSLAGKQSYVESLGALYTAAVARAREANALEQGIGRYETNEADDTQSTIIQDAIARLLVQPIQGPLDPMDLTATANRLYPHALSELQRMHPFRFTRTRRQLDATTQMVLRPGDDADTVGTEDVPFVAASPIFVATDVGFRLLAVNGGTARITGFTSTTEVTATIEYAFDEDFLTEPEATITPAAVSGTGITITASVSVFTDADVGKTIENLTGTGVAVITAQAGTTATVTITEAFPNTNPIAAGDWQLRGLDAGDWHIAPAWRWTYRYDKPEGFLRLLETQCPTFYDGQPVTWFWGAGWRWPRGWASWDTDQPTEEPAVLEGLYLVSDAGPTLDIEYVKLVTDPALFEPGFSSILAAFLAWHMALPLTKSVQIEQVMGQKFAAQLKSVRTADKLDTRVPPKRSSPLTAVRF